MGLKVLACLHYFLEALGKNLFSCLSQLLEADHIVWLMTHFHLQSWQWLVESSSCSITLTVFCLPLLQLEFLLLHRSHLDKPGDAPYFEASWFATLIPSATLIPLWVTFTHLWEATVMPTTFLPCNLNCFSFVKSDPYAEIWLALNFKFPLLSSAKFLQKSIFHLIQYLISSYLLEISACYCLSLSPKSLIRPVTNSFPLSFKHTQVSPIVPILQKSLLQHLYPLQPDILEASPFSSSHCSAPCYLVLTVASSITSTRLGLGYVLTKYLLKSMTEFLFNYPSLLSGLWWQSRCKDCSLGFLFFFFLYLNYICNWGFPS